jgi:hypothetical protein
MSETEEPQDELPMTDEQVETSNRPAEPEEEPKKEEKGEAPAPKKKNIVTKQRMYVKQTSPRSALSHKGQASNISYFFPYDKWVIVDPLDEEYFEGKTEKNDHWKVKREEAPVYEEVHFVKFKGSTENPITLVQKLDGGKELTLPVGDWVEIDADLYPVYEAKALTTPQFWQVMIDKKEVEK